MNLLWLERRHDEAITRRKQDEVHQRVAKWSIDRSRDESEYLRKRESTKLVAGLERTHRPHVDSQTHRTGQKHSGHHRQDRPLTAVEASRTTTGGSSDSATTSGGAKFDHSNSTSEPLRSSTSASHAPVLVLKSTKKQDMKRGGSGMHFRNELPSNYTPPSRHSNQSSSSSSLSTPSWRDRGSATPVSASTPSTAGSGKQTLETPNVRTRRSSNSSSGSSGFSDNDDGDDGGDGNNTDDETSPTTRKRGKDAEPASDVGSKVASREQRMKLEPYHMPYFTDRRSEAHAPSALSGLNAISKLRVRNALLPRLPVLQILLVARHCKRADTRDALVCVNEHCCVQMYPRGTIPPQAQPADPEFRHLYDAAQARRVVGVPPPEKPEGMAKRVR